MMIFVIILAGISVILPPSLKLYQYSFEQGVNGQNSQQILNEITNELRYSSSILRTSANQLQYDTDKNITYDSVNKAIIITKSGATTKTLAKGRVGSISFDEPISRGNKKEIKVTITFASGDLITTKIMTLNDIP
ncbi:MAG: hypothetical protein K0R78_492 [Pelosinus sp.]|nr:hypothetical protein [Pelosinus sp.]